jgi:hypothetical protein
MNELKKALKQMFKTSPKNNKEQQRLWRTKNKEKIQSREREYYKINKEKINTRRRANWKLNNEHLNTLKKSRRNKNKALKRLQSRIDYWKQQQKSLADSMLKFKEERAYIDILAHSVPTFVLCEQL